MGRLKNENSKKCFSILRSFIADAALKGSEKERAMLALEQLQKITAGTDIPGIPDNGSDPGTAIGQTTSSSCLGSPRIYGIP